MSNLFKPRRGSKSTMTGPKSNTILEAGEMFFEIPDNGPNSSTTGRIMLGDGTSTYNSLNPFMEGVQTATVTVAADSSTTSTSALGNIASNKTTGELIGSLKKAVSLTKSELNTTIGSLDNLSTVDKSDIVSAINEVSNNVGGALYFNNQSCTATTGDFCTITNNNITTDYVLAEAVFDNPSSITTDVTWTTDTGTLTLNGTCASATTVNIVLVKQVRGGALYFNNQSCTATTGDFCIINNSNITSDYVVTEAVFANPSAITSSVTWITSAGTLTLNGTCVTATTVNIVMVKKNN